MPATPVTKTFPVTGRLELLARVGRGSITVTAADDVADATVTIAPRDASSIADRSVIEMRGSTLAVLTPRQGGVFDLPILNRGLDRSAADITITVPSGTDVKLSAHTADITLVGRMGSTSLAFGSSTASVQHIDGDLQVRFGSGTVTAGQVSGKVVSRSGSGAVHIDEVGGALTAGCGSGALEIGSVRGTVHARSGSGTATLGAVYADVDLASGSGAMTIGLPAGVTARLDLLSGSGDVATHLPVEGSPAGARTPITVRARTGSGPVRIVPAA